MESNELIYYTRIRLQICNRCKASIYNQIGIATPACKYYHLDCTSPEEFPNSSVLHVKLKKKDKQDWRLRWAHKNSKLLAVKEGNRDKYRIWVEIFKFLDTSEIFEASKVCRNLYWVSQATEIWKEIASTHFSAAFSGSKTDFLIQFRDFCLLCKKFSLDYLVYPNNVSICSTCVQSNQNYL